MPVLTDIPQLEEQFRRTFLSDDTQIVVNQSCAYRVRRSNCHTLTPTDFNGTPFRSDYVLVSSVNDLSELGKQSSMISLANQLLQGSKPLVGKEMEILNKTFTLKSFQKPQDIPVVFTFTNLGLSPTIRGYLLYQFLQNLQCILTPVCDTIRS